MANRKFTQEFKDSTVQLALNSKKSVIEIGKDLDINHKTIYNWIKLYKQANNIKIDGRRNIQVSTTKESIHEENKRLRAEIRYLNKNEIS